VSATSASAKRPRLAPSNFHKIRRNIERVCTNSLSPQDRGGIGARGACQRREAAKKCYDRSERQNNGEKDPAKGWRNSKNSDAEDSRQHDANRVPQGAAYERQQKLFGDKKSADGARCSCRS